MSASGGCPGSLVEAYDSPQGLLVLGKRGRGDRWQL